MPPLDEVAPETEQELEKTQGEVAHYNYLLTYLEKIERSLPQGLPGLDPAHRNISKLQETVEGWRDAAKGLEIRLHTPED